MNLKTISKKRHDLFQDPHEVVHCNFLDYSEKKQLLKDWKLDLVLMNKGEFEGMHGGSHIQLHDVIQALNELEDQCAEEKTELVKQKREDVSSSRRAKYQTPIDEARCLLSGNPSVFRRNFSEAIHEDPIL
jgi:hypothetical protein